MVAEEWAYLHDNPHERELRQVCELARIDYGRIDYAVVDGRIQVWEINSNSWITNPTSEIETSPTRQRVADHLAQQFEAALRDLQ
jgi:hypothetical protein